jgi:hypothetical protein
MYYAEEMICSVSQVNEYVKSLIANDENLRYICVKGEISNFKRGANGHCYFSLKDSRCLISAVMFSDAARKEISSLGIAVDEILGLACKAFCNNDLDAARDVEPLEEVIDKIKDKLRSNHISRLQQGDCSIESGFVWSDLLTNLERTSDHCSNIALCVIDAKENNMNLHASGKKLKKDKEHFVQQYYEYAEKYSFKD